MRHQTLESNTSFGDALIDLYVDWRHECAAVRAAYERWGYAERADCAASFAAYGAALDREERAANIYAEFVERVSRRAPRTA